MAGYSPERAMREFLRRGGQDQTGLDDLARRVAERRRELLQRHNLDGTLQEVKELLDRALLEERKQLARDAMMDDADRAFREMQLDNLPDSTAAAVSELSDYDWASREAREDYEKIKDLLGREMLDQRFAGMKQALEGATDEDRAAINEMLDDLNELLEKHQRGEDTDEDFEQFMDKHGDFFPERPNNIDELLDALAQRSAAAQRMLNSMSPEQRQELMELSRAGVRLAAADAVAGPARRQPPVAAAQRGLGRLGALRRRAGARPRRRHRRAPGPRRPRRPRRPALPVLRRRPDGRRRPRQARPPARRRGRRRRPHAARAREGAARQRHDAARLLRAAQADAEGDAPARQGAAARRGQEDVRSAGSARPAAGGCGRRAVGRDPRVGVRRHRALGHPAHRPQRRTPPGCRRRPGPAGHASRTSRSARPRRAPRRRSRCSSTRRSRWRWTAAGCR